MGDVVVEIIDLPIHGVVLDRDERGRPTALIVGRTPDAYALDHILEHQLTPRQAFLATRKLVAAGVIP